MTNIDTEITNLKNLKSSAEKNRMMIEVQKAQAEKNFQQSQKFLEDEFGISTVEEAKSMLLKMEKDLNDQISLVQQSLKGIG